MFNWFMMMFGLGPVARAIQARLKAKIRDAEVELIARRKSLDDFMQAERERLQREHDVDYDKALENVVSGLLKR